MICQPSDIKGVHHTKREAYDLYQPKPRSPFNSVNFRNLAPACYECKTPPHTGEIGRWA